MIKYSSNLFARRNIICLSRIGARVISRSIGGDADADAEQPARTAMPAPTPTPTPTPVFSSVTPLKDELGKEAQPALPRTHQLFKWSEAMRLPHELGDGATSDADQNATTAAQSTFSRAFIPDTDVEDYEVEEEADPLKEEMIGGRHSDTESVDARWRRRYTVQEPPYQRHVSENGIASATGRRKSSVANVRVREGNGSFRVNGQHMVDYFPAYSQRDAVLRPLLVTATLRRFDVEALASGGGYLGQAGAVQHGLARALQNWQPEWRPVLKAAKLLRRDARVAERKKPGQPKARAKNNWSKR